MGDIKRIHSTTFRDARKLGLANMVEEVGVRIQTGEFDPGAKVVTIIVNPKGTEHYKELGWEDPYFMTVLNYGPSNIDGIAILELAKKILADSVSDGWDDE